MLRNGLVCFFLPCAGMILSLIFILLLAVPRLYDATILKTDTRTTGPAWAKWSFGQLVVFAVWWVLWLAAAASVSTTYEVKKTNKGLTQDVGVILGVWLLLW